MERKKRAMTHEKASFVKLQGHRDATEFAHLIGLQDDYKNDPQAKKDVIDFNGDGHSVKSGKGYWHLKYKVANTVSQFVETYLITAFMNYDTSVLERVSRSKPERIE